MLSRAEVRGVFLALGLLAAVHACAGKLADAPAPIPRPLPALADTSLGRARSSVPGPWRFAQSARHGDEWSPAFRDDRWDWVAVPHTWNGKALPFEQSANAWYRTRFVLPPEDANRRVYLVFEGVATVADVYLNGKKLGQHRGAYTRFVVDATDAARFGATDENVLAVKADNTDDGTTDCIPSAPVVRNYYKPYGGIYRKAWLLEVDPVHVDPEDFGSSGVYLTPKNVSAASADLAVRTMLRNASNAPQTITVVHHVRDHEAVEIATARGEVTLAAGARGTIELATRVESPHLWGPRDPYLYTVTTELAVAGVVRDLVVERTGFRAFALTENDFVLNGASTPLRGINKHQETERHLTAVTDEELTADWDRMQELGVNFVRLAHYPHAELEYRLADERGLVVWAENGHSTVAPSTDTGVRITREMVRQNYNHPSIVFWSAGNEVADDGDDDARDTVERYARAIKEEDTSRLVTYASNSHFESRSFDFIAHNIYEGWYSGKIWDFEADAAKLHFVSETGARAVVTHHVDYADAARAQRLLQFESEEYAQLIAESRAMIAFRTAASQIPLFTWWAMRDFALDQRIHGINDSGLLTYDGARAKDGFWLFQSYLRPELPVVRVVSDAYFVRRGRADNGIKAYSNLPRLRLLLNGADQGEIANGAYAHDNGRVVTNVFYWPVALFDGMNDVVVTDGQGHESAVGIYFAGSGGRPPGPSPRAPLVQSLTSSNAAHPAFFFDRPVTQDFPAYYELDGTADNTFAEIPTILDGARAIATKRMSKPENRTDLAFTIDPARASADVFVLYTDDGTEPSFAREPGFEAVVDGVPGEWRDDAMNRVRWKLTRKRAVGGESVRIPGATRDYVVLVK